MNRILKAYFWNQGMKVIKSKDYRKSDNTGWCVVDYDDEPMAFFVFEKNACWYCLDKLAEQNNDAIK